MPPWSMTGKLSIKRLILLYYSLFAEIPSHFALTGGG
jgi:hypothetical protein